MRLRGVLGGDVPKPALLTGDRVSRFDGHRFLCPTAPVFSVCLRPSDDASDQRNDKQHQKDEEQEFRDARCRDFDSCKTE